VLQDELEARGLSDLVEIRFNDGHMHSKVILIDDEFLVIGSQNFHYSAWGETLALNEYNLATENQEAIDAYRQSFEYYWQNSVPADSILDS
ncbi:MAG: phospholipase D-like domain-containing protein, partial [Candidatus Promineifilaceae bacterium]|nr:phospholipase D-like domain-containing protein [Candidatus Promineifilaceae bacterium]